MKSLTVMSIMVVAGLCSGCQYGGDMLIYYLIDGGVSDSGVALDGGDTDTDSESDSDTDSEDLDGGVGDAGCECMAGPCCSNGCDFDRPEDQVVCEDAILYRCTGLCENSQVEQMLDAKKYCDGSSDSCTGLWVGTWEVWGACENSFACEISLFGLQGTCTHCSSGCNASTGVCNP